ncbi:RpiB/LacA/LacB family sugar-phosphate isomerase [Anaerolentibacter hominis]|uniref:RpiB/LacA/LacB family sugar-phosphate isomerase n=1 Tax=Anaerolentibacter hominis TaxID=3079009 RepID=UPI0031B88A12
MKIALMNEVSQSAKNAAILAELQKAADANGHQVYNVGMTSADEPQLSYIHLGMQACILLNSKAADFVVTGCGTGQGAMISLNNYPGVICGLVVEPTDAFLFAQINNGNAISIPYAKGYGWGAELNIRYIFEKMFSCERGMGYPPERREPQQFYANLFNQVKAVVNKDVMTVLKSVDQTLLKEACANERFKKCLYENSQVPEITEYIKGLYA